MGALAKAGLLTGLGKGIAAHAGMRYEADLREDAAENDFGREKALMNIRNQYQINADERAQANAESLLDKKLTGEKNNAIALMKSKADTNKQNELDEDLIRARRENQTFLTNEEIRLRKETQPSLPESEPDDPFEGLNFTSIQDKFVVGVNEFNTRRIHSPSSANTYNEINQTYTAEDGSRKYLNALVSDHLKNRLKKAANLNNEVEANQVLHEITKNVERFNYESKEYKGVPILEVFINDIYKAEEAGDAKEIFAILHEAMSYGRGTLHGDIGNLVMGIFNIKHEK